MAEPFLVEPAEEPLVKVSIKALIELVMDDEFLLEVFAQAGLTELPLGNIALRAIYNDWEDNFGVLLEKDWGESASTQYLNLFGEPEVFDSEGDDDPVREKAIAAFVTVYQDREHFQEESGEEEA